MRILLAVITVILALACTAGSVWSFASGLPPLLGVVLGSLAAVFGVFTYHDYQYFFGKK